MRGRVAPSGDSLRNLWASSLALVVVGCDAKPPGGSAQVPSASTSASAGEAQASTPAPSSSAAVRPTVAPSAVGLSPGEQRIERENFSFVLPAGWAIEDTDPNAFVTLRPVYRGIGCQQTIIVKAAPEERAKRLAVLNEGSAPAVRRAFTRWGELDGEGTESTEEGASLLLRKRNFVFVDGARTVVVMESCPVEALEDSSLPARAGFLRIEATFRLRP
jgi:hypothetical protein